MSTKVKHCWNGRHTFPKPAKDVASFSKLLTSIIIKELNAMNKYLVFNPKMVCCLHFDPTTRVTNYYESILFLTLELGKFF